MSTTNTPSPHRAAFLKLQRETRAIMMRETGRPPSQSALDKRMRADARAEHENLLEREGV